MQMCKKAKPIIINLLIFTLQAELLISNNSSSNYLRITLNNFSLNFEKFRVNATNSSTNYIYAYSSSEKRI